MSTNTELVVGTDALDHHYKAIVLADSVNEFGNRLTTFKLHYPRFIHSEMMTHRVFSRNAASSRAIPTKKLIEQVEQDPYIPAIFNYVVKGMGVGEPMSHEDAAEARRLWIEAAQNAARVARLLLALGLDKSRINRILEPFLWYTAIFTGTEWENFLALRDHEGAQPEIQAIARAIKKGFELSTPQKLEEGEWHLPLVNNTELGIICKARSESPETLAVVLDTFKKVSASRCARVSFDRTDDEPQEKTLERAETLMGNGHFSPFEHVARPVTDKDYELGMVMATPDDSFVANFRGWYQMRKDIANEDNFGALEASR